VLPLSHELTGFLRVGNALSSLQSLSVNPHRAYTVKTDFKAPVRRAKQNPLYRYTFPEITLTSFASMPLVPFEVVYSTLSPSFRDLNPSDMIFLKCTNTSSVLSAGLIKPKPLFGLNHLT
jgi:hypothetical protein